MKNTGTCEQRRSFRRGELEAAVLDLLRNRLMQPDAVAEFIAAFGNEMNARRGAETADRSRLESERSAVARKLDGLYDAIPEGMRNQGLKGKLEDLEARLAQLDAELATPPPSPVRLHPNLSELYRQKVTELAATLNDAEMRTPALEVIRGLIERVTVHDGPDGVVLDLEGAITSMIGLAQPAAVKALDHGSVKVVAGARNRRYLPQLRC